MKEKQIKVKKCECGGDIYELITKIGIVYQCKDCGEMHSK